MARQKKQECPPGAPMWLQTYGDMMTLILCFFVLLYSFSTLDTEKLRDFAQSFAGGEPTIIDFRGNKSITGLLGNGIIEFPTPSETKVVDVEETTDMQQRIDQYVSEVTRELQEAYASPYNTYFDQFEGAAELGLQMYDVTMLDNQMMEIKLGDSLFDPGSAVIKPDLDISVLAAIVLDNYQEGDIIVVEGHTDTVPLSARSRFLNNWELSGARASAIIEALMKATGLPGSSFEARQKGEYYPIADNDSPEGRALNRRVLIYMRSKF